MRIFSRVLLCLLLIFYSGACSTRVQEWAPPDAVDQGGRRVDVEVVGLIDAEGEIVYFDEPVRLAGRQIVATVDGEPYSIGLDGVSRLLMQRLDYHAGGIVVAVVLVGIIIALIVAEANEPDPQPSQEVQSCPFVYSFDGEVWRLDAEPFGGAITAGLERDDYSPLENLQIVDGEYRVMLRNEQPETQYVNVAELWVVDHDPGFEVFPGPDGQLYPVSDATPPSMAVLQDATDVLNWVMARDLRVFESAPVARADGGVRDLITLTFPKPPGATEARLVADVSTGGWGAEMLRHSLDVRGRSLTEWYSVVDQSPVARELIEDWSLANDLFDLRVEVDVGGEWVTRGSLRGGGPIINEARVIPLDLTGVTSDVVRLRVSPPVGFWGINSLALDYEMLPPLEPSVLPATTSLPDSEVRSTLVHSDEDYYVMPSIGNWTELRFDAPPVVPELERTVLLHSEGYYRIHADATGEPDAEAIDRITNEIDGLARIGVERYAERQMAFTDSVR